jgi:hypothetical protein
MYRKFLILNTELGLRCDTWCDPEVQHWLWPGIIPISSVIRGITLDPDGRSQLVRSLVLGVRIKSLCDYDTVTSPNALKVITELSLMHVYCIVIDIFLSPWKIIHYFDVLFWFSSKTSNLGAYSERVTVSQQLYMHKHLYATGNWKKLGDYWLKI